MPWTHEMYTEAKREYIDFIYLLIHAIFAYHYAFKR